jgi:hypothetical protein
MGESVSGRGVPMSLMPVCHPSRMAMRIRRLSTFLVALQVEEEAFATDVHLFQFSPKALNRYRKSGCSLNYLSTSSVCMALPRSTVSRLEGAG